MPSWGYFIILWLVVAVMFSALFSGSEIVYTKVNKLKLKRESENNKKAKQAYKLTQDYTRLIDTILVGNNLVNIGATSAATLLLTYLYPEKGALISSIVMTLVILIFGEIIPKTILSKYSYKTSLALSGTLTILEIIFFPIVYLVKLVMNGLNKLWTPKEKAPTATDEELEVMVDEIEEEGFIDEDTSELLKSAIDFVDVMAYEIMKPRVDLYMIDIDSDINELLEDPDFFRYTRIPVYEETIDNVIGVVNTNDILKKLIKKEIIDIKSLMVKPIFVHKTKTISSVLKDFKEKHYHFAIVIDEFGGTLGVVTLEDILEELVGEIYDEFDEVKEEYKILGDNQYLIDGDMNIDDFFELIDFEDEEFDSEYSTVGGFITERLERFPEKGDTFDYKNLSFEVVEVDGVRVEEAKVVINLDSDSESESIDS